MSRQLRYCPRCARELVFAPRAEGWMRQVCPDTACGFVHWDNPVPVVAALVEYEGYVVLARNKLWPPKMFGLITGFLEREDPDPASGVLREVEEELGLSGDIGGFIGHYPFERMNQLIVAYHVRAAGRIHLGEELAEYKCIDPRSLRPWDGATGRAVHDWLVARGITPPAPEARLHDLPHYAGIDAGLATAGQPSIEQFQLVAAAGFDTVINLAAADSPGALPDEATVTRSLGLHYRHLPVDFAAPRDADFDRFCELMREESGRRVLVHCAANKRASVFVYLWRRLLRGDADADAQAALERVWQPDGTWAQFIARQFERADRRSADVAGP
ncbi:MAG: NUDIX domain-containing protein [Gammaproteobacteria bacterium]|nr:NUDIX domain-containing protein [Gammaproteobacteria bacterium]